MLAWVLMRLCDLYSSSRSLSHRNQTIDLLCKSMDWFLYDSNLGHEKVNRSMMLYFLQSTSKETWNRRNAIYNICHKNSPLRLLFCVPNVVYPYDLKMSTVKLFSVSSIKCEFGTEWKVSKYGVFSDPYFPAFGLNTERYSLSLHIHSECGKIQTRKNPVFGHFSCSGSVPTESAMRTKYSNGPDWK